MKKYLFLIIFTLTGSFITTDLYSAEKIRVAILDLEGKNIPKSTAGTVSEMITTEMVNIGSFQVVERNQLAGILKEQGLQQTGCTDQSCAVEIGKLLSARKMLTGSVSKIGDTIVINIRMVDVQKGIVELAAMEQASTDSDLPSAVKKIVKKIAKQAGIQISDQTESGADDFTGSGYYMRGILPGWGQIYSGNNTKGYIFMAGFVLAGAGAIYGVIDFNKKDSAYMDLPYGTSQSEYDKKNDEKKSAGLFALSMISVTGLIYAANWIDLLFFNSTPDMQSSMLQPDTGHLFFSAVINEETHSLPELKYNVSIGMKF